LGAVQPIGGARESFFLGHGEKGLQLMNIHKVQPLISCVRCPSISTSYVF
jgi:hypothetical protein